MLVVRFQMLHQHLSLATNTQCETLHVMIIHEIGKALVSVAKTLEDYLDPILAPSKGNQHQKQQEEESQQEGLLEFLCAIANDMVSPCLSWTLLAWTYELNDDEPGCPYD